MIIDGDATEIIRLDGYLGIVDRGSSDLEYSQRLLNNLWTYAITRKDCDFESRTQNLIISRIPDFLGDDQQFVRGHDRR